MPKLLIKYLLIVLVISACRDKEIRLSYYDNGQVREKVEIVDSKKNGTSWEYDSAGNLMNVMNWKDDIPDGPHESYYANGRIRTRGTSTPGKRCEMNEYYPSGRISKIYYFDEAGLVIGGKSFLEDGTFDRTAFTFVDIFPYSQTQKLGSNVTLRARVLNVYDSIYFNGRMIITSRVIQYSNEAFPQVADTLALIRPNDSFTYLYDFKPKKSGHDTLKAMMFFQKDLGDEIAIKAEVIIYPFYVE